MIRKMDINEFIKSLEEYDIKILYDYKHIINTCIDKVINSKVSQSNNNIYIS